MAGRDTPPAAPLDEGGEDPSVLPADGVDILSLLPNSVIIMEILPRLGEPDNQGEALGNLLITSRRLQDVIEEFLIHAPDSYLAHLSMRRIEMLENVYGLQVRMRMSRYKGLFPIHHRELFSHGLRGQQCALNETALARIMQEPAFLLHRSYRDMLRDDILRGTNDYPEDYSVSLLRLCRIVGIPLVDMLETAMKIDKTEGDAADMMRFAIEECGEVVTDDVFMSAWRRGIDQENTPIIFDVLVDHMIASGRIGVAIRNLREWSRTPGIADEDQIQRLWYMVDSIIGDCYLTQSSTFGSASNESIIVRLADGFLTEAIERRQPDVARVALELGEHITMEHIRYVWQHNYFIESPGLFGLVVANMGDALPMNISDSLRRYETARWQPALADEAAYFRAYLDTQLQEN